MALQINNSTILLTGASSGMVNLRHGEHKRPDFLALNPRGTIPVMVLDSGATVRIISGTTDQGGP